MQQKCRLM